MSNSDVIKHLGELAKVDAVLKALDEEYEAARIELTQLQTNIATLGAQLEADKARLGSLEKTRKEMSDEVRSFESQRNASRMKLGKTRTERESHAVEAELKDLERLKHDREEEVGKIVAEKDALQKEIEQTESTRAKFSEQLSQKGGGIETSLGEIEGRRLGHRDERDKLIKAIPMAILRRYDMVRQKRGSALSTTTDGTCRTCHMHLPPQLFHRLKREPLLEQCPSCNRFIYYVATPVEDAD